MISRGDVYDADLAALGVRPVVVVTREVAIPVLASVTVVLVTSTIRGHAAEVAVGGEQGLDHDCVANCDNVLTVPKRNLLRRRGALRSEDLTRLDAALRLALGLE